MQSLIDARMEPVQEAFRRYPGTDRAVIYVLDKKQRLAWKNGIDGEAVLNALLPILGKQNLVLK